MAAFQFAVNLVTLAVHRVGRGLLFIDGRAQRIALFAQPRIAGGQLVRFRGQPGDLLAQP